MKTSPSATEAAWRTPAERMFIARDVSFRSGETLPELRLSYTVLGNPAGAPVLVLHGTGRGMLSPEFGGQLFGAGQPLDAATHFIVSADAIGHGRSIKSSDGLGTGFPRYGDEDMVDAQHRLVTEGLGLHKLRVVLGRPWAACTRGCGGCAIRMLWTRSLRSGRSPRRCWAATG
ncbi:MULTISPECIES: hypothetical protein [unclassified Variovorax]|uniref:hypothetical protein n=1 Tax=unclassified Variovorax TaxID=663243 RepID=UPI001BD649E2|nr:MULTISPECIES: hypothetical protein [unclassified Variovorax]